MTRHSPEDLDPTDQTERPVMVTGAVIGVLVALGLMVVVYFLAR